MAKNNRLLKQMSHLEYEIEFNQSYQLVYQDKIEKMIQAKVEKTNQKHAVELKKLEIEALDNQSYLTLKTDHLIEKLEHRYYWKLRAVKHLNRNKDQSIIDQKIEQHNQVLNQRKEQIIAKYTRNYTDETIKKNLEVYEENKQLFLNEMIDYENKLKNKYQLIIERTNLRIDEKISKLTDQLNHLKSSLSSEGNSNEFNLAPDTHLKLENLSMHFGGLKAVDDLSFEVKKGEIFGLIGPNGAGKTTVFNCITQFYKPTSGNIIFRNLVGQVVNLNQVKVHDVIKEGVVRTFQNVELIWELNILDNLLVGAHSKYHTGFFAQSLQTMRFKREEAIQKAKALKILTDLELIAYAYAYPLGLPYGILKRIELARTLMTNPSLIILDEPAAGLNDKETEDLAVTIKSIQKNYNCTIFLVEHDMGLVMGVCDTICAISFGQLLAIGTPTEIQNHKLVKEAYLGGE